LVGVLKLHSSYGKFLACETADVPIRVQSDPLRDEAADIESHGLVASVVIAKLSSEFVGIDNQHHGDVAVEFGSLSCDGKGRRVDGCEVNRLPHRVRETLVLAQPFSKVPAGGPAVENARHLLACGLSFCHFIHKLHYHEVVLGKPSL
jgi:hypothetical protein